MSDTAWIYEVIDVLRATAAQGLVFCENGYDRERYEQVMRAAARLAVGVEQQPLETVMALETQFLDDLGHLSPAVAVEAVVLRGDKILLIQRSDNQMWALPGGLTEVGETPAEAAVRELREEAGLRGEARRILGLFDSRRWNTRTRRHLYTAIFEIQAEGEPQITPPAPGELSPLRETLATGFFGADELPPLSQGHDLRVPFLLRRLQEGAEPPYFD